MTHRERVLKTFRFEHTDRVPYDLMEGFVWPDLMAHFQSKYGLENNTQVWNFLDTDFRWVHMRYVKPPPNLQAPPQDREAYTRAVMNGPLENARTTADVDAHKLPDPALWQPADYAAARQEWQDHALVFMSGWMPLFWSACLAFGMEAALINMIAEPKLFEAFIQRQHEFNMDILSRGLDAAKGFCDICWMGDDFAGQKAMLMHPDLWRKHIKPYLSEQVRLARDHGMYVLYHSCGAVRPILSDLIDIGVNGLLVFQTSAVGMDAKSIASEFGGKLAFYGGIDVQQLLSYGTVEDVKATVRANVKAFEKYGGYIVTNSHHFVKTIKGENVEAMYQAVKEGMN